MRLEARNGAHVTITGHFDAGAQDINITVDGAKTPEGESMLENPIAEAGALESQVQDLEAEAALEAAILEAKLVVADACMAARIAAEAAQPYLEAAQQTAQILEAGQRRLYQLQNPPA